VASLTICHRLTLRHGMIIADWAQQMAEAFYDETLRAERSLTFR
jgi:hypothetical protein